MERWEEIEMSLSSESDGRAIMEACERIAELEGIVDEWREKASQAAFDLSEAGGEIERQQKRIAALEAEVERLQAQIAGGGA